MPTHLSDCPQAPAPLFKPWHAKQVLKERSYSPGNPLVVIMHHPNASWFEPQPEPASAPLTRWWSLPAYLQFLEPSRGLLWGYMHDSLNSNQDINCLISNKDILNKSHILKCTGGIKHQHHWLYPLALPPFIKTWPKCF